MENRPVTKTSLQATVASQILTPQHMFALAIAGIKYLYINEKDIVKIFQDFAHEQRYARCRGGVEDTRLKAKVTKKIRGQGQVQPFRGQTLSRPRTGMLEAKAKDQGHKRKCSPKKKKGLHKNFSGDLKKKKRSSQKYLKRSPRKNVFQKIFQALHKILTIQNIVLSSSRGQANFRGLEASRPRTSKCVLKAKDVLEDSTSGQV